MREKDLVYVEDRVCEKDFLGIENHVCKNHVSVETT